MVTVLKPLSSVVPQILATFTGSFGGGFISLGSGNDNITFSGAARGTTIKGTGDSDTINLVAGVVFGAASVTASQKSASVQADMRPSMEW